MTRQSEYERARSYRESLLVWVDRCIAAHGAGWEQPSPPGPPVDGEPYPIWKQSTYTGWIHETSSFTCGGPGIQNEHYQELLRYGPLKLQNPDDFERTTYKHDDDRDSVVQRWRAERERHRLKSLETEENKELAELWQAERRRSRLAAL